MSGKPNKPSKSLKYLLQEIEQLEQEDTYEKKTDYSVDALFKNRNGMQDHSPVFDDIKPIIKSELPAAPSQKNSVLLSTFELDSKANNPNSVARLRNMIASVRRQKREEDQINWIVVSMCRDINILKQMLQRFPRPATSLSEKDKYPYRSGTLICSGAKQSHNTPMQLFGNCKYGVKISPTRARLLLATKVDCFSSEDTPSLSSDGIVILQEKNGLHLRKPYSDNYRTITTTKVQKHGIKSIYDGGPHEDYEEQFYTDISRYNYTTKTWNDQSSFDTVAVNVLHRKTKNPIQSYNELILVQQGDVNPIDGIVIPADQITQLTEQDIKELLNIFKENIGLKLFIYDLELKQHIVREVSHEKAIELLQNNRLSAIDISYLPPFLQEKLDFTQPLDDPSQSSFISEKNEPLKLFLEKQQLKMLRNLLETTSKDVQQRIFDELYKVNQDIIFQEMLKNSQLYSKVLSIIFENCIQARAYEDDDTGFYYKNFLEHDVLSEKLEKYKPFLKLLAENNYTNFEQQLNIMLQKYQPLYSSESNTVLEIKQISQKIIDQNSAFISAVRNPMLSKEQEERSPRKPKR